MAKYVYGTIGYSGLLKAQQDTTIVSVCGSQPTSAAQATASTYSLGTLAFGSANMTLTSDANYWYLVTAIPATVALTASGTVNHIAYTNTGTLVAVATCAPQAVSSGGTVIVGTFCIDKIGTIS